MDILHHLQSHGQHKRRIESSPVSIIQYFLPSLLTEKSLWLPSSPGSIFWCIQFLLPGSVPFAFAQPCLPSFFSCNLYCRKHRLQLMPCKFGGSKLDFAVAPLPLASNYNASSMAGSYATDLALGKYTLSWGAWVTLLSSAIWIQNKCLACMRQHIPIPLVKIMLDSCAYQRKLVSGLQRYFCYGYTINILSYHTSY